MTTVAFSSTLLRLSSTEAGVVPGSTATGVMAANATSANAAIAKLNAAGGGTFEFAPGVFSFSASIIPLPNVRITGAGQAATVLKAGVDGFNVLGKWVGPSAGECEIDHLTVWGYGDRNPTLGNQNTRCINIGPFNHAHVHDVTAIWSREESVVITAVAIDVHDNLVTQGLRDGIDGTFSTYFNAHHNRVIACADDGISCSVATDGSAYAVTGLFEKRINICDNILSKCLGISTLGGRNVTIQRNYVFLAYDYAIKVSLDGAFSEGLNTRFAVNVSDNIVRDLLSASILSGTSSPISNPDDIGIFITMAGYGAASGTDGRSLGSGGTATPVFPGYWSAGPADVQSLDQYINYAGSQYPRGNDAQFIVSNNILRQTLAGFANFSDAGYGLLWWRTGFTDAPFTTDVTPAVADLGSTGYGVSGIVVKNGSWDGLQITGNDLWGYNDGIQLVGFANLQAVAVKDNNIRRVRIAMAVDAVNALQSVDVDIAGNNFDVDPMVEHPYRTSPIDGSWSNGASSSSAIYLRYVTGIRIHNGNRFRNCNKCVDANNGSLYAFTNNDLFFDWSAGHAIGTGKGIGEVSITANNNNFFFENSDPTAGNWKQANATADSGYVQEANVMPAAGYFFVGQTVYTYVGGLDVNGFILRGWYRMTSSNSNVVNADWAPIQQPSISAP